MLAFAIAAFALMITPGPGVLSIAGVGSSFGARSGLAYLFGLCAGNFLVGCLIVSGLAALVFSVPYLRTLLLVLSAIYLVYLALKIALSGSRIGFILSETPPGFIPGVVLQLINPKCYAVNITLFTGFAFYPDSLLVETVLKFAIYNAVWLPIHFIWLYLGVTLKRLALSEKTQRLINMLMGVSLMIVVALAALS